MLVFAQTIPTPELNTEKIESMRREQEAEHRLIQAEIGAKLSALSDRMDSIEKILYGLVLSTGGVGLVVGADKASYYWRRSSRRPWRRE